MDTTLDIVCLSHLRWDFVFQRPHHLLVRFARHRRVFYFEEPVFDEDAPRLEVRQSESGVIVATPHLPGGASEATATEMQRTLLENFLLQQDVSYYGLWYYTPMAVPLAERLTPVVTVYDCMDELSAFLGAPVRMKEYERVLFERADLVFTGGHSLYEAKRRQHPRVHLFPSSVDVDHFARARHIQGDPADQRAIPRPRAGYFGVIDERLDLELIRLVAADRSDWNIVMVGPVAKIDPESLPRMQNIHYLGPRRYDDLPSYLAGWDVALMPFALNESTRFISPTKTPEFLAARKPVVSTAVPDVRLQYGHRGFVDIANSPEEFATAMDAALLTASPEYWADIDAFLASMSWDRTFEAMQALIDERIEAAVTTRNAVATAHYPDRTRALNLEG